MTRSSHRFMTYAHYTALEQHRRDLNLHLRGFARRTSKSLAAVASMCSSRVDNRLTDSLIEVFG